MAKKNQLVPDPTQWWDAPAGTVVGARERGLLASINEGGRFDGPMTVFSREGGQPLIESQWKDGVLDGPQVIWREPFFRTGAFTDGKPTGEWTLYWNEHPLVTNTYEAGAVVSAVRHNSLNRTIEAKATFIVNGNAVDSLEDAIAMGDKVESLGMSGWMEAELPEEIWSLTSLRELQIYYSLVAPIPAGIGNLSNLRLLDIKGCNIGWIDPAIGNLEHLEELKVVNSGLGVFPAVKSPVLRSIDVSSNIMARVGHSLAECTGLEMLKMRDNYVMTLDDNVFSAPNLKMLDVAGSIWIGWISPAIGDAKNLVNLTLYEQCLLSLPDEIAGCEQLQNLNLFGCHLAQPPLALERRPIGQLNLDNTPLHAVPGYEDFEAQLRESWAQIDDTVAAAVALENLSLEHLGIKPPDALDPFEVRSQPRGAISPRGFGHDGEEGRQDWLVGEAIPTADFESWSEQVNGLTSADFGCESGDNLVELVVGPLRPVDVPAVELLMHQGVLRIVDAEVFEERTLRHQGSPLVEKLSELAPLETWMFEAVPELDVELAVGFVVQQMAGGIWAVVGPTVGREYKAGRSNVEFRDFEPADGDLRKLLEREVAKSGGTQLCYRGLDREVGVPTVVVFEDTRHRAIEKYLVGAGLVRLRPADSELGGSSGPAKATAEMLRTMASPWAVEAAGVAVRRLFWLGQGDDGIVLGLTSKVVRT